MITQINAGQPQCYPAKVSMVVDIRVNDCYSNAEVVEIIQNICPMLL